MAENAAAAAFNGILLNDPERVLNELATNVAALVGVGVSIESLGADSATLAPVFGNKSVYLFPVEDQQGTTVPALFVMDIPGAANTGGALIMMKPEAIKQVVNTATVPDMLHDSIGEVANIIVGATAQILSKDLGAAVDFRRGAQFRLVKSGKWPAVLVDADKEATWGVTAGRILFEGEEKGTILLAAAGPNGNISGAAAVAGGTISAEGPRAAVAGGAAAATDGFARGAEALGLRSGLRVQVAGFAGDLGAVILRESLEQFGIDVLPLHAGMTAVQPDVMFVVSRSHTDIKLRLGAIAASGRRPAVVIACSDRPTREIVMAARMANVDDFLVLPADPARLLALLKQVPSEVSRNRGLQ